MTYDELETLALSADDASKEQLRALLRRDWDVRVLDAACSAEGDMWETYRSSRQSWEIEVRLAGDEYWYPGANPDADRHAAALAVFPTLAEAKRAELGECP